MNIERELRFYIPLKKLKLFQEILQQFQKLGRYYEITTMYDNPNPKYTFYSPLIDGRLRLRSSIPADKTSAKESKGYGLVSWKQRIPSLKNEIIRHEIETEFNFEPAELSAVQSILENVLRCPKISSYERYRNHYKDNEIHITLDEFPFGLMLELELEKESNNKDIEKQLKEILFKINLDISLASLYSCDDMYRELCSKENKHPKQNILFDDPDMPKL